METLASWLWNPFLALIYLETGVLFPRCGLARLS